MWYELLWVSAVLLFIVSIKERLAPVFSRASSWPLDLALTCDGQRRRAPALQWSQRRISDTNHYCLIFAERKPLCAADTGLNLMPKVRMMKHSSPINHQRTSKLSPSLFKSALLYLAAASFIQEAASLISVFITWDEHVNSVLVSIICKTVFCYDSSLK